MHARLLLKHGVWKYLGLLLGYSNTRPEQQTHIRCQSGGINPCIGRGRQRSTGQLPRRSSREIDNETKYDGKTEMHSGPLPIHHNIGALIIRMGFGLYYTIIIIRSPQNPSLIIKGVCGARHTMRGSIPWMAPEAAGCMRCRV